MVLDGQRGDAWDEVGAPAVFPFEAARIAVGEDDGEVGVADCQSLGPRDAGHEEEVVRPAGAEGAFEVEAALDIVEEDGDFHARREGVQATAGEGVHGLVNEEEAGAGGAGGLDLAADSAGAGGVAAGQAAAERGDGSRGFAVASGDFVGVEFGHRGFAETALQDGQDGAGNEVGAALDATDAFAAEVDDVSGHGAGPFSAARRG